jgi:phosphatidylglycerophosphate synthase
MVNKLDDQYSSPADIYLCRFIDSHLHVYHHLGFTPNMVTTLNLLFGLLAAYEIIKGNLKIAILYWTLAYYFDCVDGKLARKYEMVTTFGDYYDHASDIIKNIAVLFALFKSNKGKTTKRQWTYLGITAVILIITCFHMGYQETLYNKKEESGFLNICTKIVAFDSNPSRTIQYSKYFGCGTFNIFGALLIFFWRK